MTQSFGLRVPQPRLSPIERLRKHDEEQRGTAPSAPAAADPRSEAARLRALDQLDILDTPPEEAFDRIARLTKSIFGVPIALVSFIDAHRQWYKANDGLSAEEAPRRHTFCTRIVERGEPLVVPDATKDPCFAENPFVVGPPHVRFYAGAPLRTHDGKVIGSLCVIDTEAREFDQGRLALLQDLAQMVMYELELRVLAKRDSLTGAHSRRAFKEEAGRAVALALRHHEDLACLALDLDHFKAVNDTYGHGAGDRVLAEVIATCEAALRETDIIGRLGGEEFAILLPHTDRAGASEAAEKLRAAVERLRIDIGGAEIGITASFGVAVVDRTTQHIDALLQHADEALYAAKAEGRNRVSVWRRPDGETSASRRRVLKGGRILFNDHNSSIDCTVRSLSDEGAGLDVSNSSGIPKRFDLEIKADHFVRRCRITSQGEKHLEVEFEQGRG
jgi:diguanylate cyclase (GGDEF)-like protein